MNSYYTAFLRCLLWGKGLKGGNWGRICPDLGANSSARGKRALSALGTRVDAWVWGAGTWGRGVRAEVRLGERGAEEASWGVEGRRDWVEWLFGALKGFVWKFLSGVFGGTSASCNIRSGVVVDCGEQCSVGCCGGGGG